MEAMVRLAGRAGAEAYADAVTTYLAFALDNASGPGVPLPHGPPEARHRKRSLDKRYPDDMGLRRMNPLADSTGNWSGAVDSVVRVIARLPAMAERGYTTRCNPIRDTPARHGLNGPAVLRQYRVRRSVGLLLRMAKGPHWVKKYPESL